MYKQIGKQIRCVLGPVQSTHCHRPLQNGRPKGEGWGDPFHAFDIRGQYRGLCIYPTCLMHTAFCSFLLYVGYPSSASSVEIALI